MKFFYADDKVLQFNPTDLPVPGHAISFLVIPGYRA